MSTKGKLVVLEGLDGSGKETQASLLMKSFLNRDVDVRLVSFPVYTSDSSALVRMYLSGQFGQNPEEVNAYAASTFYAVDRYASYKSEWKDFYEAGGIVLADRWTTSNAVHQCSKLPRDEWSSYLEWLFDFEYRLLGIPEPDLVIYLRMDPAASCRLVEARCMHENMVKDIHENDPAYLACCQEAAEYCSIHYGWNRVECSPSGNLRTIENIHEEIVGLLIQDEQ